MVKMLMEAAHPDGQKNSQKQLALMVKKLLAARPDAQKPIAARPNAKKPIAARLKGQKLLAQGNALGIMAMGKAPWTNGHRRIAER